MSSPSFSARFLAVWLLAFAIRALYVWQISDAPFFGLRFGDADAYHTWAQRIAAGDWMGSGVFYQAPLYPYVLAIVYRLFGDSATTVRVVQAAMGATSCALVAASGVRLFGPRGWIAGLLLAIYPSAIFLDALLEKSALVTLLTALLIWLVVAASGRATGRTRWVVAGGTVGLLTLTRENALLLIVPVAAWIVFSTRAWMPVLSFVAGCAIALVPVGLRNYAVGGEFHLTTSQLGPNFYIGNHAGASGSYEALVIGHGNPSDERDDATREAERLEGRSLTPAEVSRHWTRRAIDDMRSAPIGWLALLARKTALTFNAASISDTESQDVYAEWSSLLRLVRPIDFGVLLGLAVLGMVVTAHEWRRLWLLYGIGATYALSVIAFYVVERYRFPLVLVLTLFAGAALARFRAIRFAGVGLAVLAVACAHVPVENARSSRATHFFNIAPALAHDPEQAGRFYGRALEEAPEFPAAHFGVASILSRAGRTDEAIAHYRQALATWPDYAEAHLALARALLSRQQAEPAAAHYQTVVALQPHNAKALVGWGIALDRLGQPERAIEKYRLALDLDPNDVEAHNNMGVTLGGQGRFSEAIQYFERVVALNPADERARQNLKTARQLGGKPR